MTKNITKSLILKNLILLGFLLPLQQLYGQFQLNGNGTQASLGNDCYRLTTAANNKFGSMWFRQKADLTKDFDLSANLNFGTNNGGADGIVFAFQDVCTSAGGGGGGMGITGVTPSLFVEFDTYQNTEYNDPTNDHLGILKNGNVTHGAATSLVSPVSIDPGNANVENGADWLVRILWTQADSTLKVYVNNNLRISYTGNIVSQIFNNNPYVYWGFTAATGGLNNEHKVCISSYPTNVVKLEDVTMCQGTNYQANLPGGTTYAWSPNYNISSTSIQNPILFPDTTTSYIVSITDACGNIQKDTMVVTVNPKPNVQFNFPISSVCVNANPILLTGGTPANGSYSGTGVTGNQFNPSIAGVGNHSIIYTFTNSFGCQAKDTSVIQVTSSPLVSLANINPVCFNQASFALSGGTPTGGVYSGAGVSNGIFDPAQAGVGNHKIYYSVSDINNCIGLDSTILTVYALPNPTIQSTSSVICNGNAISLSVNSESGVSYQWLLNGSTVTNLSTTNTTFAASQAGVYTVYAENTNGCSVNSSGFTLTAGTNPNVNLTASDTSFCPGNSVTLTSSLGSNETAEWYLNNTIINGQQGANLIVNQAGNYFVKITSATGCTVQSSTISISQLASINAAITSTQTTFCPGTTAITLTANGTNASYVWYEGANMISGATNATYDASSPGNYSVVITASSGCSSTSNVISLISGTTPSALLTATDTSFCPGSFTTLDAVNIAGANYQWYLNGNLISGTGPSIQANQAGNYSYTVTNAEGCSNQSNSLTIVQKTAPTVSISASSTTLCPSATVTITANASTGVTYEWFRNGVSLGAPSASNTLNVSQTGSYQVKVNNGCVTSSNTINITAGSLPGNVNTIFGNGTQCPGNVDDYSINSVSGATYYLWELIPANAGTIASGQGTTDVTIHFLQSNVSIKVTPQNACGNGGSLTETVVIDNSFCFGPMFGGYSTNLCPNGTVTFTNYTDNSQYVGLTPFWEFGTGANPATATGNGPFNVTYSSSGLKTVTLYYVDGFGNAVDFTEKQDYIFVSNAVTTSAISGNLSLSSCSTIETYSVSPVNGSSFQWSVPANASIISGQGTNQISVSFNGNAGNISVVQTNATGCVGSAVTVQVSCTLTSTEDNQSYTFEVFPNPTQGKVNFLYIGNQDVQVDILDVNGKLVQTGKMLSSNQTQDWDLSHLTNGLYFVRIQNQQMTEMKKLIIQK